MKPLTVSTLVPTYNESMNVIPMIKRLLKAAEKNSYKTEIIVIDDDSPDKTWKLAGDFAKKHKYKNVRVIRRKNERGLATAIARGISEAKGDIISWLDVDMGVPPEDLPRLVKKLKDCDVAIGSRYVKGGKDTRPWFRGFLSKMLNIFAMLVLGFKVRDYTSGFVAARKEVFKKVKISSRGFGEYFIEFAYKCIRNKYKVTEIGYVYESRKEGTSKSDGNFFLLFSWGIKYALYIIQLRHQKQKC